MSVSRRTILYVWGDITGLGGTERRMGEVTTELVARGHQVHSFAHSSAPGSRLQELMRRSGAKSSHSSSWIELRRQWHHIKPDVVIAFGLRPSLASRLLRITGSRTRRLVMARNGLDFLWKGWMHHADRLTSRTVDLYIANSLEVARHLIREGISERRVHVIGSALGEEWAAPTRVREGRRVVAMIGNDRPEKNQLFGVRVFLGAREDSVLRIYTNNGSSIRDHLTAQSDNPRTKDVEIFEGVMVGPSDLDQIDLLLHPSLSESLPRTVLEARARGCRVVASDTGDTRLHVPEGAGTVLSGWDLDAYVTALESNLREPRPAGRWGEPIRTTSIYVDELLQLLSVSASGSHED